MVTSKEFKDVGVYYFDDTAVLFYHGIFLPRIISYFDGDDGQIHKTGVDVKFLRDCFPQGKSNVFVCDAWFAYLLSHLQISSAQEASLVLKRVEDQHFRIGSDGLGVAADVDYSTLNGGILSWMFLRGHTSCVMA